MLHTRRQRTQLGNGENGVDIPYEKVYTVENGHHDIRHTLTTYVGIRLDPRLTFWVQIRYAASKAAKVTSLLSELMANIGGATQSKQTLFCFTAVRSGQTHWGSIVD